MKRGIPDFLIEQLSLEEVEPEIRERLMRQPEVADRLERLRASNAEILAAYPPAEMGRRIEGRLREASAGAVERADANREESGPVIVRKRERLGTKPSAHLRRRVFAVVQWKGFYPALAAAAILALAVGVLPLATRGGVRPVNESGFHVKGVGPVLHVYRETPAGAERLANGAVVRAHDLLQLSYLAGGARYGMIFSIDGSGTVTLHYPQRGREAAALESGGEVALPYSYELDNAPSFERFYFVTSERQFPLDEILALARKAVKRGGLPSIAFPAGFQTALFTLKKDTKR